MSSESDSSLSSDSMHSSEELSDSGEEMEVVNTRFLPYQDKPLARTDAVVAQDVDREDTDADGLTPATLAARYHRHVTVDKW